MTDVVKDSAQLGDPAAATTTSVTVDAVIVAYNSRDTLRACVSPLAALPWVNVTVVDNASPDDSAAAVADLPIRTIRTHAKRRVRLRVQPRDRCRRGGIRPLPEPGRDDRAGKPEDPRRRPSRGSGPRGSGTTDRRRRGSLQLTQRRFPRLRSTYSQALGLHHLAPQASWAGEVISRPADYARPGEPDWLSGGCVLMRRAALDEAGGLDECFFLYSEETDLFRRLRDRGGTPASSRARRRTTSASDRRPARAPPRSWRLAGCATHASITARSSASWKRSVWRSTHSLARLPGPTVPRVAAGTSRPRERR